MGGNTTPPIHRLERLRAKFKSCFSGCSGFAAKYYEVRGPD